MYKVLRADKDTYITDRIISGRRSVTSSVGAAGSLDMFKLYGVTMSGSTPNVELSRLMVHFDLNPLRTLVNQGRIDITSPTFKCRLKLRDVYGGQPTPMGFTAMVYPLSRSFDEGLGKDVVYYSDHDVCNFLSSSRSQGAWLLSGCALGSLAVSACDYITGSAFTSSLKASQFFTTGEEDLDVDVTPIVSSTLAGIIPDSGFRISYDSSIEADTHTYFVKRFGSRTAFNEDKRPRLIVKFDDSVTDDAQNTVFDNVSYLFLYNYMKNAPANITSGSTFTQITGSNSLILKLATEISGGWYNLVFTGSQHTAWTKPISGVYSASINVPSTDLTIAAKIAQSGSVKFTPIWGSLDGSVTYLTGSVLTVSWPSRTSTSIDPKTFYVTVLGLHDIHRSDEETVLRINIFDQSSPLIKFSRIPYLIPGITIRDVYYGVRDTSTNEMVIPFDTAENSTKASSDASGMFFKLDMSNLTNERSYVIDVLLVTGNNTQRYLAASPVFRVSDLQ
jgi:hypothetical protein